MDAWETKGSLKMAGDCLKPKAPSKACFQWDLFHLALAIVQTVRAEASKQNGGGSIVAAHLKLAGTHFWVLTNVLKNSGLWAMLLE